MRKILTFLFAALMSVGMWAIPAPTSGSCGDNLSWEFDSSSGTLTITGTGAMYDYDDEGNYAPWLSSYHESITSVIISNGVTSIGQMAFYYCTNLPSVTIPNSVTSIGLGAFAMCSSLESVTILAESLVSYGAYAFNGTAEGLKIYVPAGSVNTYKAGWAAYEDKIEAIAAPTNPSGSCGANLSWEFDSSSGTLTITGSGDMYDYDPDDENYAPWFSSRESITSVIIPDGVTSIGDYAFMQCTGLTSVTIPNSVEYIGEQAFLFTGLTSVTIPNSVASIGDAAFGYCPYLETVTINAESLESYGSYAFEGTAAALKIYVPAGSVATYKAGWADYADKIEAIAGGGEPAVPAWVLEGDEWDDATKTLTVNSNPGYQAYSDNTEIEHVIINNGVTSLDTRAFMSCSNLESVTIPSSVTSIGGVAFGGCTALTSIEIPNSVEYIAEQAFAMCIALTSIEIPNSVEYIEEQAFAYSGLTSIEIPNSVDSIGVGAFYLCTGLTSVTIPNSVKYIEAYAFAGCTDLTSITIPNSVEYIGADAFAGCTAVTDVYCYPNAADLTWEEEGCDDFIQEGDKTVCHVHADQLSAYQSKFTGTVNVTFVDDLPAPAPQGEEIIPNVDPQNPTVYYSTFYDSAKKYELPEGVEAYVATIGENVLNLTKIAEAGQVIPNDNAVILKSTVASFILTPSEADAVTFSATNSLQGTDVAKATPANCYVLGGADGVVGFYPYSGTNLNPHKAYVVFSGSNNAPRRMPFIFDAATGVENVQGNVQSTKVLRDGQLIIIRNGVEYNANGMMVK